MRTTFFFLLLILCLALSATAFAQLQIPIYSKGPIDGRDWALFITGPNLPSFLGSAQDISNGFVATNSGVPNTLEFGEWIVEGLAPSSFSYEIGTSAFGTDLGSGIVAQNAGNSRFLFRNAFAYDVYDVTVGITSGAMTAGNTYWLSISNADDPSHSETEAWDTPNGGSGGQAICNFRQSGTNFGACIENGVILGGESFTLSSTTTTTLWWTPEPSTILLFGSGILGLVAVLRRKLNN
jgi:hypothetical protein